MNFEQFSKVVLDNETLLDPPSCPDCNLHGECGRCMMIRQENEREGD